MVATIRIRRRLVSHASAGNRAHGISVDEENESSDDVHLAQRLAADERLRRAEHFLSDVGHVIRDVDDVLTGKIIDKRAAKRERETEEDDDPNVTTTPTTPTTPRRLRTRRRNAEEARRTPSRCSA